MLQTTTELLADVKLRAGLPASQSLYTDTELLRMATEEMHRTVVPLLMRYRSELLVRREDVALTGQGRVRVPARAFGSKLRDVQLKRTGAADFVSLPLVSSEDAREQRSVEGFYLEGDWLYLTPEGAAPTGTLRIKYFTRPSHLVGTDDPDLAMVEADYTTTVGPFAAGPAARLTALWDSSGGYVDIVRAEPSYELIGSQMGFDRAQAALGQLVLTSGTLMEPPKYGDWLCLPGYAPVAMVPAECFDVLIQATVVRILRAKKEWDAYRAEKEVLETSANLLDATLAPRVDGEPKRFVNRSLLGK